MQNNKFEDKDISKNDIFASGATMATPGLVRRARAAGAHRFSSQSHTTALDRWFHSGMPPAPIKKIRQHIPLHFNCPTAAPIPRLPATARVDHSASSAIAVNPCRRTHSWPHPQAKRVVDSDMATFLHLTKKKNAAIKALADAPATASVSQKLKLQKNCDTADAALSKFRSDPLTAGRVDIVMRGEAAAPKPAAAVSRSTAMVVEDKTILAVFTASAGTYLGNIMTQATQPAAEIAMGVGTRVALGAGEVDPSLAGALIGFTL